MSESNPYRAPVAAIADFTEGDELELAGRGHRFGAFVIDTVILVAILVPLFLSTILGSGMLDFFMRDDSFAGSLAKALIGFTVFTILQGWFLKRNGQTIGKKLVGIRMVDLAGNPPGLWRLLTRRYSVMYLVNLLPGAWGLLGTLDFLFIFRADRRCVHDLAAGTKVVMHGARHSSATWFIAPLATAAVLGIGAAVVIPMFESGHAHPKPPKPARAGAPAHPVQSAHPAQSAHAAGPAQTPQAGTTQRPAATAQTHAAQTQPAQTQPAQTQSPAAPAAADAPAETPPASPDLRQHLRKCAALGDPAAVIRCSQAAR